MGSLIQPKTNFKHLIFIGSANICSLGVNTLGLHSFHATCVFGGGGGGGCQSGSEYLKNLSIFYIPWPFPPVWGVVDNTKRQKQWVFYSFF